MSFKFSEESKFLMQRWRMAEELLRAKQAVNEEFKGFLYSLEEVLKKKDWWSSRLRFKIDNDTDVYVTRKNWGGDKEGYIWIGVEDFSPKNLLGTGSPAVCYLWVQGGKKDKLLMDLARLLKDRGILEDYVTEKQYKHGNYVVQKPLRKYALEDDYQTIFKGEPLKEIARFIEKVYLAIKDYKIQ
jgi:hypothetical protein